MNPFFQCSNCGECCGPIPLSRTEHVAIKRAVRRMGPDEVSRLQRQDRDVLTCILWDTEQRRCSVYDSRPLMCRMFGFYEGMDCPNNVGFATGSRAEGSRRINEAMIDEEMVGVLSVDIVWGSGL